MRFLSETAIPAEQCDWVIHLVQQEYPDDDELSTVIRQHISRGNVVVLQGYPFQPANLNVNTIWKQFKIHQNQPVEALGEFHPLFNIFKCLTI